MNCATHNDIAAVAYCRTCGKPLCANCKRDVKGVIYCENCLAERLQGVQPPAATYQQVVDPGVRVAPLPGSGPNPALAGILAGFFPLEWGRSTPGSTRKVWLTCSFSQDWCGDFLPELWGIWNLCWESEWRSLLCTRSLTPSARPRQCRSGRPLPIRSGWRGHSVQAKK